MDRNKEQRILFLNMLVALRKESVDRNARDVGEKYGLEVALRKESVDRNDVRYTTATRPSSRSPQGERG